VESPNIILQSHFLFVPSQSHIEVCK